MKAAIAARPASDATSDPSDAQGQPGLAARLAALRLLDAVLRKGLPLEAALPSATRDLPLAGDRGLAHFIAATVLRHLADLDALIDSATARPLPPDAKPRMVLRIALAQTLGLGTPPHAAIATALPLVDGGQRRLVHGVFGTLMRQKVALASPPLLPDAVHARWREAWGEATIAAARRAIERPPAIDLMLRDPLETAAWAARLGGETLAPGHVRLPAGAQVDALDGYADGAWWVQDLAASLPVRLFGAGAGRRAIDLGAAPGGKTMQLAAAGWRVTALDLSPKRAERLRENLARTRLAAEVVVDDMRRWSPPEPADAVLLDAPCSATGIFRRHPDVLHRVTARAIAELAAVQRELLASAAQMVRPGGRLVYAVCSAEPEEGEAVVEGFDHPGFVPEPIDPALAPPGLADVAGNRLRVRPGACAEAGGADAFFVAAFRRIG